MTLVLEVSCGVQFSPYFHGNRSLSIKVAPHWANLTAEGRRQRQPAWELLMNREQAVQKVATMLMSVFQNANVLQPNLEPRTFAHSVVTAPSGRRFLLEEGPLNMIRDAARKLAPYLDYYPLETCGNRLCDIVVAEKDAGTAIQQAQAELNDKILQFLDNFENQGEWEILYAVRGIDPSETNFTVGTCNFFLMDDEQFALWGRRYSSGTYTPPDDAPLPLTGKRTSHLFEDRPLLLSEFMRQTATTRLRKAASESKRRSTYCGMVNSWWAFPTARFLKSESGSGSGGTTTALRCELMLEPSTLTEPLEALRGIITR